MPRKKAAVTVKDVGARLRTARKEAKLSGKALADAAELDAPRVSRFETGKKGLESENLLRLFTAAHSLGISLDYVILGQGNPLRSVAVIAEDSQIIESLIGLGRRLESARRGEHHSPSQLPRAGGDSK